MAKYHRIIKPLSTRTKDGAGVGLGGVGVFTDWTLANHPDCFEEITKAEHDKQIAAEAEAAKRTILDDVKSGAEAKEALKAQIEAQRAESKRSADTIASLEARIAELEAAASKK